MNQPIPSFSALKINLDDNSTMPIYRQLAEILRDKILTEEIPDGARLPSEAQWANALNINHLTLRKSLKILSEQRLITQRQGKGTFVQRTREPLRRVGILINDNRSLSDIYNLKQITAITCQLQKAGGAPRPINCSDIPPEKLMDEINQNQCDELLVLNCPKEHIQQLYSAQFDRLPMVFINNQEKISEVTKRFNVANRENFITQALDYLKSLGHQKVLYISIEHPENLVLQHRNREFLEYDLPGKINAIQPFQGDWYQVGLKTARKYCASPHPPTAILTSGISFAFGAWNGALESGLKIPQDLSLIAPDGIPMLNATMTTLDPPIMNIVNQAIELLSDMQREGKHLKQKQYFFDPQLIERGSCRKLKRSEK